MEERKRNKKEERKNNSIITLTSYDERKPASQRSTCCYTFTTLTTDQDEPTLIEWCTVWKMNVISMTSFKILSYENKQTNETIMSTSSGFFVVACLFVCCCCCFVFAEALKCAKYLIEMNPNVYLKGQCSYSW